MSTERQKTVTLQDLLSKLAEIKVSIEERDLGSASSYRLIILSCKLPEFPFRNREHVWYPLLLAKDQHTIDRDEVDAILRHLWHSSTPFFEDELEEELEPTDPREEVIAQAVESYVASAQTQQVVWEGADKAIREKITFEMSESELEFLEALLNWRKSKAKRL